MVKSYALNGAGSVTDYGVYDEVVNLTDGTPADLETGSATFRFDRVPSHFYFEGKTAAPFRELPWTVTLRYTLNGVPAKAEDLAGKTGVVEIFLNIVPNEGANDYARYNYTLEAMALFNEDDILSLEAPGAQVQLVGNLRAVLFLALPGEEQHFSIRVGSEDFSFGSLTVLMVPATLAQLEEIAKLSQRKDDLEEDYRNLSGSLDALLDALNDVQDGLYASASGLDQLDAARGTISAGKGKLYDEAGVLRGDLSNIAGLLEPVEQRTLALSQTITASKGVLGSMTDTVVSLRSQLDDLEKALAGLESGAGDVRQVIRGLADMKSSLRSLQRALGDSHVGGGSSGDRNTPKLKDQVEKTKQVGSAYNESNDVEFMAKMLELQGQSPEQIAGIKSLVGLTQQQAEAMGVASEWQAAQGAKAQTDAMYQAKGSLSFQQFCGALPGVDDKTAKQMSDLWTAYNSGAETVPTVPGAAGAVLSAAVRPGAGLLSAALAGSGLYLDEFTAGSLSEAGGTGEAPSPAAGDGKQTVGGAAVDLIVDGLDNALNQANNKINAIQNELNSTIDGITRPTGRVVGELADLCDDVDDLVDLIDSAEDLSICQHPYQLRYQLMMINSSYEPATDQVARQLEQMNEIIFDYDPDAMVTGEGAMYRDLIDTSSVDFQVTNYISIAAIFLIIAFVFRSVSVPLVLVATIELAIFINQGCCYFLGTEIPFIAPTIISCVQLGATVDYAILMTSRFQEELRAGKDREQAIRIAAASSDASIVTSALVLFCATLGVSFVSSIDLIGSICVMLSRGALISALVSIFLMPAVLYVCEPVFHKTSLSWRVTPPPRGLRREKKEAAPEGKAS